MITPPTPPQKATEYLQELAQYYRELIEYHQQAAIAAAQQLGHVEALLGNDPGLPTQQVRSWLVDESAEQTAIATDSTDEQLEHQQGLLKHLWSQVPDAPDCWTLTLLAKVLR